MEWEIRKGGWSNNIASLLFNLVLGVGGVEEDQSKLQFSEALFDWDVSIQRAACVYFVGLEIGLLKFINNNYFIFIFLGGKEQKYFLWGLGGRPEKEGERNQNQRRVELLPSFFINPKHFILFAFSLSFFVPSLITIREIIIIRGRRLCCC